MIELCPEYFDALLKLYREAAADQPAIFDQIEEPYLCEDGKTYVIRAYRASDDREFSVSYEIRPTRRAGVNVLRVGSERLVDR